MYIPKKHAYPKEIICLKFCKIFLFIKFNVWFISVVSYNSFETLSEFILIVIKTWKLEADILYLQFVVISFWNKMTFPSEI